MDASVNNEINGMCTTEKETEMQIEPEIQLSTGAVCNVEFQTSNMNNTEVETIPLTNGQPQMLSSAPNIEPQYELFEACERVDTIFTDDSKEEDLSAVEIATSVLEQNLTIDDTDLMPTDESNEVYEIMNVCSTTAQAIKKTISEVLNSRANIVIAAGDSTNELEFDLSKRIADFENVVSGCFPMTEEKVVTGTLNSSKPPELNTCEIVEIKEVYEETDSTECDENACVVNSKDVIDAVSDTSCADLNPNTNIATTSINPEKNVTGSEKPRTIEETKEKESVHIQPKNFQKDATRLPAAIEDEKYVKKLQKSSSNRKKGEKTVEHVLKSLPSCSSNEEKIQILCKRNVETLEELRLLEPRMKQLERQVITQQREKEQLQAEHNRMILAKSRLESLCRELQRQSKAVKEESLLRIREEEEKRKEVANKFQVTLNDISTLMQENAKKNMQLREENSELAKKLKALVDHYDMWEKHMEKVVEQKHLEARLANAKHAKINLLLKQETEKFLREKQVLLENMSELQKKCTLLTSNELQLRTELGDYTNKYEEFQSVLNKSSQVFASFKSDMESTSKKIKKLEKETNVYKQKWESSNKALLSMINDKQNHDKEVANAQQRVLTLEKLCRALQAERNDLQNQLNVLTSGTVANAEKDASSQPVETEVA